MSTPTVDDLNDEGYVLPDFTLEGNDMFGSTEFDGTLQDMAALNETATPAKRSLVRPLILLVSVVLLCSVVVYAGLGGYDFVREWMGESVTPPVVVAPATTAVPVVPVVLQTTVVVTKVVIVESAPVTVEVTSTPQRAAVVAAVPELVAPDHGQTYSNSVVFDWNGVLNVGEYYQVVACLASGACLRSPYMTDTSWTLNIPAVEYGGWYWTVQVVTGSQVVRSSEEQMFWFDPFSGGAQ